jgi:hypothetical protein
VLRFDAIADLPIEGLAERSVMLAAVRWVNERGELWPVLENWSHVAGLTVRGLQRALARLVSRGILEVVQRHPPGVRKGTKYRIPALTPTTDRGSGVYPRLACPGSPTGATGSTEWRAPDPRPGVIQSAKEQPKEEPTTSVAGVVARLAPGLRNHPNSTPARLAWIERDAPSKSNPDAWAAECIRKGYKLPPPTREQTEAARKARRADLLARFDAMPEVERAAIMERVRRKCRNLADRPDDDYAIRSAIVLVMAEVG